MKLILEENIKYCNEALLLADYVFNNKHIENDIYSENKFDSGIDSYMYRISKEAEKISVDYPNIRNIFLYGDDNNIPSIMYSLIYSDLSDSISDYTIDEFGDLIKQNISESIETFGFSIQKDNIVESIDSVDLFSEMQKFNILKLFNNTNKIIDSLYEFIHKLENIIKKYQNNLEELFDSLEISYEDIQELKDFGIIKDLEIYKELKSIKIIKLFNFNRSLAFSVEKDINNIIGVIFIGIRPYLQEKDSVKNEDFNQDILNKMIAVSDETRFNIIKILSKGRKYGKELSDILEISTGTVSYHINTLIENNLVQTELEGRRIYYSIKSSGFNKIKKYINNLLGENYESIDKIL